MTVHEIADLLKGRLSRGEPPMKPGDPFGVADLLAAIALIKKEEQS